MVFDNLFRDVKTKASAALGLLGCEIRIENFMQLAGRDTSAIVFHAKIDIKVFWAQVTVTIPLLSGQA